MSGHDIIVIGASAGGVEALRDLVRDLPSDVAAAIFIVLHIPAESPSLLPAILGRANTLKALHPRDGAPIEHGHIYIAPPDHHLLVEKERVHIIRGPKENRHRPAVDPLFRSAALAYGPRVIGVVLTGALDDGTAGLQAIKQQGGITVVQDPNEAMYSGMPASALAYVAVDYCEPLARIAPLLTHLISASVMDMHTYPVSDELEKEVRIANMDRHELSKSEHVGTPSAFSCPECGGVLWELQHDDLLRFRCRVGHAYSIESIASAQLETVEEALWTALKTLQESVSFSARMEQRAQQRGQVHVARRFEEKKQKTEQQAMLIRQVLLNGIANSTLNVGEEQGKG